MEEGIVVPEDTLGSTSGCPLAAVAVDTLDRLLLVDDHRGVAVSCHCFHQDSTDYN